MTKRLKAQMALVMGVIDAIRNIRGEMGFAPSEKVEVQIRADSYRPLLEAYGYYIRELARVSEIGVRGGRGPERGQPSAYSKTSKSLSRSRDSGS